MVALLGVPAATRLLRPGPRSEVVAAGVLGRRGPVDEPGPLFAKVVAAGQGMCEALGLEMRVTAMVAGVRAGVR